MTVSGVAPRTLNVRDATPSTGRAQLDGCHRVPRMAFPDRIERTVHVPQPPARVWAALTTAEGLAGWFGDEARIDLREGGSEIGRAHV